MGRDEVNETQQGGVVRTRTGLGVEGLGRRVRKERWSRTKE